MNNQYLPEFQLNPGDYGWSGLLGDSLRFFGQQIGLEIHTCSTPRDPKLLPPVSRSQEALVRLLVPAMPAILQRVESELVAYNQKSDPDFWRAIDHPHIWLNCEHDDGLSWTFVIERKDNLDFGYHAEFRGTEFLELWAGD